MALNVTAGVLTNNGSITVNEGLGGARTISADLVNNGILGLPAGLLSVTGSYSQSAGGTLTIEIGGLAPVTEYDGLAISGGATLAGTLAIVVVNGFTPALDDSFEVVTASGVTNMFGTVDGDQHWGRPGVRDELQRHRCDDYRGEHALGDPGTCPIRPVMSALKPWFDLTFGLVSDSEQVPQKRVRRSC